MFDTHNWRTARVGGSSVREDGPNPATHDGRNSPSELDKRVVEHSAAVSCG
jgi:hypothetical protein